MTKVKKEVRYKVVKTVKQHIIRPKVLHEKEHMVQHIVCVITEKNTLCNYISCIKYKHECKFC